jgi:hypothetical protein
LLSEVLISPNSQGFSLKTLPRIGSFLALLIVIKALEGIEISIYLCLIGSFALKPSYPSGKTTG